MKKRVLAVTMAALMAASLTACGGASNVTTAAVSDTVAADKTEAADGTTGAEADKSSTEATGGKLVMATNAEFPPY